MDNKPRCAPGKKPSYGSCFTLEQLIKIAYAYNQKWMKEAGKGKDITFSKITIRHNKEYLLEELKKRLKGSCGGDQTCWIQQDFVKRLNDIDISRLTFRPHGPQGRFEWLSTTHIEDVLSQYQVIHRDFAFLGAVPMDFDDLAVLGIRNLPLEKIHRAGVSKLGIVFNTDEHYKPGQHWVAGYIDLNKNQVYFFDSTGQKPDKRVVKFYARVAKYMLNRDKNLRFEDLDIRYNSMVHQRGDSECGLFSINFIVRLLGGETFQQIVERKLTDAEVNQCRKIYFRNVNFSN